METLPLLFVAAKHVDDLICYFLRYYDNLRAECNLPTADTIDMDSACKKFIKYLENVAVNLEPIYFIVPCLRL